MSFECLYVDVLQLPIHIARLQHQALCDAQVESLRWRRSILARHPPSHVRAVASMPGRATCGLAILLTLAEHDVARLPASGAGKH